MTAPRSFQIIAIHGAPRSGTTWLGQIFNSSEHVAYRYQPMFSYAFKGRLAKDSSLKVIDIFFDNLLKTQDDFILQRGSRSLARYSLEFSKKEITHLVYKEVRYHDLIENLLEKCQRLRLVFLIRDPRAVMYSWLNAPREFDPSWCALDEWRSGQSKNAGKAENWYGFSRWKELAQLFMKLRSLFPSKVALVRYEALVARPTETVSTLFQFCRLDMTDQVREFLVASQARDDGQSYGVFRTRREDPEAKWRRFLDQRIARAILEDLKGTQFEQFLFDSEFRTP